VEREIVTLYNVKLITYQMAQLHISPEQLSKAAGLGVASVYKALAGELGTIKRLKRVTDALKIKWEYVTNIDLPESSFHRAVLTNGDRRAKVSVKRG
jgi:hypothetical protein